MTLNTKNASTIIMKISSLYWSLLACFVASCNQSSSDTPVTPVEDYSSCTYNLNYNLTYSTLDDKRPSSITYMDSDQKIKTVPLTSSPFNLTVNYKYGDSVFVKLNAAAMFFASKSGNNLALTYKLGSNTQNAITCPDVSKNNQLSYTGIQRDSIPTSVLAFSGIRIKK